MHFWQLAISSLPELAIVKWTFSWLWRVVWFSLDANSVIYFYLLFVAKKKYLLVFFVTCISLLFSIWVWSVFGLWINSKLLWRERALRERKKERKIEETVSLNISDSDKLSIPATNVTWQSSQHHVNITSRSK